MEHRGPKCDTVRLWSSLIGGSTFLAVLFSWHYVVALLPRHCGGRVLFLDKVCINQTDPEKKAQGIASLGGILARCATFLVVWDATYFSRLWCIYEMSAFRALHRGRVVFVPLSNGGLVAALLCGQVATDSLLGLTDQWKGLHSLQAMNKMFLVCSFLTALVCTPMLRQHAKDLHALNGQLANFSVESAKCFCCNVGHRHPETGAELACDRQHVYTAIARRQAEDDVRTALRDFSHQIRTSFKDDIRAAGWGSKVPYSLVLSIGTSAALPSLDWSIALRRPLPLAACNTVFWTFMAFPLIVGVTMELLILLPRHPASAAGKRLLELCVASLFTALLWALLLAHESMMLCGPRVACISLSLQAVCVWFLYFWPGYRERLVRRRNALGWLPETVVDEAAGEQGSPASSASSSARSSASSSCSRQSSSSAGNSLAGRASARAPSEPQAHGGARICPLSD